MLAGEVDSFGCELPEAAVLAAGEAGALQAAGRLRAMVAFGGHTAYGRCAPSGTNVPGGGCRCVGGGYAGQAAWRRGCGRWLRLGDTRPTVALAPSGTNVPGGGVAVWVVYCSRSMGWALP